MRKIRPDFYDPLTLKEILTWVSTMTIVFFGISIYPHAIQRIYAAKDEKTLKRSFDLKLSPIFGNSINIISYAKTRDILMVSMWE